jgi:hypothetical protein
VFRGSDVRAGYRETVPLSDRDRALLDFEGRWTAHSGAKEEAVRAELSLTPARYYQLLGRLVETADAVAYDPILVHRLRRVGDAHDRTNRARAQRAG